MGPLRLVHALIGRRIDLPAELVAEFPELARARYRRGGLPPRIGGWCLGQSTVSGITFWRTIWLAPAARLEPRLLLHELRHTEQFGASWLFPLHYVWESLRRGYRGNRFELDAETFAHRRMERASPLVHPEPPEPW